MKKSSLILGLPTIRLLANRNRFLRLHAKPRRTRTPPQAIIPQATRNRTLPRKQPARRRPVQEIPIQEQSLYRTPLSTVLPRNRPSEPVVAQRNRPENWKLGEYFRQVPFDFVVA